MANLGFPELLVILVVLLLLFGAKRLPEMGRAVGKGLREFKSATQGLMDDVKEGASENEQKTTATADAEAGTTPAASNGAEAGTTPAASNGAAKAKAPARSGKRRA